MGLLYLYLLLTACKDNSYRNRASVFKIHIDDDNDDGVQTEASRYTGEKYSEVKLETMVVQYKISCPIFE